MSAVEYNITLRKPHEKQQAFIDSKAKRKVVRAGRRGGKTVGMSIFAVKQFLAGHRVLYAAPTEDQLGAFWYEVKRALPNSVSGQRPLIMPIPYVVTTRTN